jgi:hypothetical protein
VRTQAVAAEPGYRAEEGKKSVHEVAGSSAV